MTTIRWEEFVVWARLGGRGVEHTKKCKDQASARRAADTAARRGYEASVTHRWGTNEEPGVLREHQVYFAAPIVLPPWRLK